jgi:O-antigen/teichoic acid export membrane protein
VSAARPSAASGVRWSFLSQALRHGVQFLTVLVLARLVSPAAFGLVTLVMTLTGLLAILKDLGTTAAVIQRAEVDGKLLSSVFWMNLATGGVLALGTFLLAPLAGVALRAPDAVPVLRVMAITFVLTGAGAVHQALLERDLSFERLARVEIASVMAGSVVAIAIAFRGGGVWSLVMQSVVTAGLSTILLFRTTGWRPSAAFALDEVLALRRFSLPLTGYTIANYLIRNADYFLVGSFLGTVALGYYTMAYRIMLLPVLAVGGVVSRVLFPVFSEGRREDEEVRAIYLRVAGSIALVTFPAIGLVVGMPGALVQVVLGPQWNPIVPLLVVLAPVGLVQVVGTTVGAIYQGRGRTDLMLYWGIFAGCLTVSAFAIGMRWGVLGVATGYAVVSLLLGVPNLAVPLRLIGLSVARLAGPVGRPFLALLVMLAFLLVMQRVLPGAFSAPTGVIGVGLIALCGYGAAVWWIARAQLRDVGRVIGAAV